MNIHFTGVGGIGMSALARYFLSKGESVSGSDSSESSITDELKKEGLEWIDPKQTIPAETELHIYTEAVPESDTQRQSAKTLEIPSRSYFQQLGEISKNYKTIAICGTHGKSTTTAMLGIALSEAGMDPLVIVGTKVREFGGKNIRISHESVSRESMSQGTKDSQTLRLSDSRLFIVEACEYRQSFLNIQPFGVVLTNCEHDHADYYKTEESYKNAFKKFVSSIPCEGFLVANFDDANVREVAEFAQCRVIPIRLSCIENPISPKVPGWHNQLNAELAFETCQQLGPQANLKVSQAEAGDLSDQREEKKNFLDQAEKSLSNYSGTWRRFDILGEKDGISVIDDYGHHPSEVKATLKALKEYAKDRRIVILFQPHQYSRTRELFDNFVQAFSEELSSDSQTLELSDSRLFITDIYEARDTEADKKAVSATILADAIRAKGIQSKYSGNYEESLKKLKNTLRSGDILLTMGAGPVNLVAEKFLK